MKKQSTYRCIIYEEGDIVIAKYPKSDDVPHKIVDTRMDVLSTSTVTQFLKFADQEDDLNVSNHFVPYGKETIEKYKEGLNFYNGVNIDGEIITTKGITKLISSIKQTSSKKETNKPTIIFSGKNPPIKERNNYDN